MNATKAPSCRVSISVVTDSGAPQTAFMSITRSPVLLPEFGMSTDSAGGFAFDCEPGLWEFTAHADGELTGKISVTVHELPTLSATLVVTKKA
jgi:hypothetical protein